MNQPINEHKDEFITIDNIAQK